MKQELENAVQSAVRELYSQEVAIDFSLPEEQFGDYATNIALQLAKQIGKSPREIGETLAVKLRETLAEQVSEVSIAGPGFINMKLTDKALTNLLQTKPEQTLAEKSIVAEYSDPNPFKVLHAGHLYTSLVGDAVSRLMEAGGAQVHRVNFGGDVGRHVGMTMWAIIKELGGEHPENLVAIPDGQKLDWVSQLYVRGNEAYETDETAKQEIIQINKQVYELHNEDDHDSPFAQIYWTCRQWSYDGFDNLYKRLEMLPFEKYYPESTVFDVGLQTVSQHIGEVYEKSDGAVIFRGEPYGLFTQVFINSEGLPTYAAKDVGLIYKKEADFSPDQSFIFTDIAQKDHLAVVMKSISLYDPKLVATTTHYTHGQIKMVGGIKMSSRKGNILRASDILDTAAEASKKLSGKNDPEVVLAAVKYAFLKNRIGGDIIYDPAESVSLEGNSGPYLQYAHARARSIMRKVTEDHPSERDEEPGLEEILRSTQDDASDGITALLPGERSLVRKLSEYSEVIDKAVAELMPHHIATYLYELAQTFNRFYENNRVIGDEREKLRLALVRQYADTLRTGLSLLGIASPDKM